MTTEVIMAKATEFLNGILKESGAEGVILGLSSGFDSTLCADMCLKILGKEKVHMYFLPDDTTPHGDENDIRRLYAHWNKTYEWVDIDMMHMETLEKLFMDTVKKTRHGMGEGKYAEPNMKARLRMMLLYFYANLNNWLVVGTCNKSEIMCGYFTKYGDGGTDFELLGDLFKSEAYELGKNLGLPQWIIDKIPSAGLIVGQTDEDELGMDYYTLDKVLKMFEQMVTIPEDSPYIDALSARMAYEGGFIEVRHLDLDIDDAMDLANTQNQWVAEQVGVSVEKVTDTFNRVKRNLHKVKMPPYPKY